MICYIFNKYKNKISLCHYFADRGLFDLRGFRVFVESYALRKALGEDN